jgi:amidase
MNPATPRSLLAERAGLADGLTTSSRLVESALARIAASDHALKAFRVVRAEKALEEAEEADRRLAAGETGLLLGVPIAVDDSTDVAGEPTAFGCIGDFPPKPEDAHLVSRLRSAGAVVIGKTNVAELGQWSFTEGAAFGATRNPWNLRHTPGGASGGAASAVAAGLIHGAMGMDGTGSVRVPAAWTHLVGIKPQRGRISTWPEVSPLHGLAVPGSLARTVADAALLLDAASGRHESDEQKMGHIPLLPQAFRDPGRLRIAVSFDTACTLARPGLHSAIRAAVLRLADTLAGLGHEVVEDDPRRGLTGLACLPRILAGIHDRAAQVPDPRLLDPRTLRNAKLGARMRGTGLRLSRVSEAALRHRMGGFFNRYDAILTPATAVPPPRIGAGEGSSSLRVGLVAATAFCYAWPWNVLGWPAMAIPVGFTVDGLPIGAQLLGPIYSEPMLVALTAQLEDHERWIDDYVSPPAVDRRAGG